MSELGDLLELLHTGGARGRSIRAVVDTWWHVERSHGAFVAGAEEEGSEAVQPLGHGHLHHRLSVDKLVALAPFTVLVPASLGHDWALDLSFVEGSERQGLPATAFVHVRSEGGHWQAAISETSAEDLALDESYDSLDRAEHWRTEVRDCRELHVREPPESWADVLVRMEAEGTRVQITSHDLGAERLVDLAARLVPAPAEPPGWSA